MCNINAIFRKNSNNRITGFLQAVSSHSFIHNNHGEGVYFSHDNSLYKNKEKIDYCKYEAKNETSRVVISHQRFSTSGFEVKYNHPFSNEDFVLVHNGVINQFLNSSGSDTSGFFKKFVEEFNKITSHLSRQQKIVKVIRDLFRENIGSYSILIYDKKTKQSYYFKNYPSIHFYKNKHFLFITTESDNKIFLPMISSKKFIELDIKPRVIYHINEKAEVFKLADLPEEQTQISYETQIIEDINEDDCQIERVSLKNRGDWTRYTSEEDVNDEIEREFQREKKVFQGDVE